MSAQTASPALHSTVARSPAAGAVHQLRFARNCTNKMLEGIPADKMCVIPPDCAKHALWIMGHLASTDDYFLMEFAGRKSSIPESWQKLFAMNSTAMADAEAYPRVDEVRKVMDENHAAALKWFGTLTAEQLAKPMPDGWEVYAPTMGDVAGFASWHEGYHGGQLSAVRKGLGLPSAFG